MSGVRKRKLMGEINVVPYIDVMLVLLIIFMVTAPMLTQGIEVELPKAGAEPIDSVENTDPLVLSVDSDGNLYLNVGENESSPIEATRVIRLATVVLERRPNTPVLVKADFRVPYGFLTDPADFKKLEAG